MRYLHNRYVRDTLEHNPDTMFQLRLDEVQVFNRLDFFKFYNIFISQFIKSETPLPPIRMGVESKRRLSFPSRLADIRSLALQLVS